MKFIEKDNMKMPALGFGTYQLKGEDCLRAVSKALETGYRHIDTAQIYENEEFVGEAIEKSSVPRKDIFLTTKVWLDRFEDSKMKASVEESLKKLRTDYVDLLLIHWPVDSEIPFAQQVKSLKEIQDSGKARHIGISNFTTEQMEMLKKEGIRLVTNQVEYHPLLKQTPLLKTIRDMDMFLTAYSPLAQGKVKDHPVLKKIGEKYGKTPGQIALRWLMEQDHVATIPKAGSDKHIIENFNIFDFELSSDDMKEIFNLGTPEGRIINPDWAPKWDKAA